MSRHFKHRLISSFFAILIIFFCIYYSFSPIFKPIFCFLLGSVISLALLEYYNLTQRKGFQPLILLGIGTTIAYTLALGFTTFHPQNETLASFVLLFSLLLFFLFSFNRQTSSIGNLAVTVFGLVYLTLTLSCALRINYFFTHHSFEDGRLWLAYVIIVTKMNDIGAYFCGKCFGKTPLAPAVSPKKTVEGAIGGVAGGLISSFLFPFLVGSVNAMFNMTIMQSLWLGLLISILAQLGDLAESLLKRDANVKDSSHLPGLGGVLDIVDSLVFTMPLMYLILKMNLII